MTTSTQAPTQAVANTLEQHRSRLVMVPIYAATGGAWISQTLYIAEKLATTAGTIPWVAYALGGTVATAVELLGLSFLQMAQQARDDDDHSMRERAAAWSWGFFAAAINYRHWSPGWLHPDPAGVVFAALSLSTLLAWEIRERRAYRHRMRLDGRMPAPRPTFGPLMWGRFFRWTFKAWSLSIRDGLTTTQAALNAARVEIEARKRARATRRAARKRARAARRALRLGWGLAGWLRRRTWRRTITARLDANRPWATDTPPTDRAQPDADRAGHVPSAGPGRSPTDADPPATSVRDDRPTERQTAGQAGLSRPAGQAAQADQPTRTKPTGRSRKRNRAPATGQKTPQQPTTDVDVSDLHKSALWIAGQYAKEQGKPIARDPLLEALRAEGHQVGGSRRKAIHDFVKEHATPTENDPTKNDPTGTHDRAA